MRFIIILLLVSGLLWSHLLSAQNIGINETGANPHGSAILDVSSTNKGMLIPRLTTAQRTGIAGPANGLLVYDTSTSSFWFYDGGAWVELVSGTLNGNTLDEAYDEGGAGAGRIISADAGVVSVQGTDGIEVTGTFGSGAGIGNPGAGTRMFFNPRKAAFRAGSVTFNQWNDANVGDYSIGLGRSAEATGMYDAAIGFGARANGTYSTAIGWANHASGPYSLALGGDSDASGFGSVAIGRLVESSGSHAFSAGLSTVASGESSSAFGNSSTASGDYGFASGYLTNAEAQNVSVFGRYNVGGGNPTSWIATDPLLEVGNGSSSSNLSNALTILKNGNVGLSTTNPSATLDVEGTFQLVDGNEAAGRVLTSDASGNATWSDPGASGGTLDEAYDFGGAGAGRVITADAGVVSVQGTDGIEVTGTFGSGAGIGSPGAGTRMLFSPRKAAFRAGRVNGNQWNGPNVGDYSAAFGNGTTASGLGSFATGQGSDASGDYSVAMGTSGASGNYSVAGGMTNGVSGDHSVGFGQDNSVTGDNAVAMGYTNFVSGEAAVAMGETTTATGYAAVSMGNFTTASGYSSTAFGNSTTASGYASTAFGLLTTAESYLSVTYGRFNVGGGNGNSWQPQDAIFEIGIGTSIVNKDNAVTVLKNGNTGIGTATPSATLDVEGTFQFVDGTEAAGRVLTSDANGNATWVVPSSGGTLDEAYDSGGAGNGRNITADAGAVSVQGTDGFEVTGTFNSGATIGNPGAGTRMFYNPRKAAFRAGRVTGTQWNDANVGVGSAAFGLNNTVSGSYSVAFGYNNQATSPNSVVMGENSQAQGAYSIAMGGSATAVGESAIAMGEAATAFGDLSVAFSEGTANGASSIAHGRGVIAAATYEFATGEFNTNYTPTGSNTDRAFVIGNGTSNVARSNAMTLLKNGNLGLGTDTPEANLHIDGSLRYEDGQEASGRVLVSDIDGNAEWSESIGFSCIRTGPIILSQGNTIVFNFAYHNRGNAYNVSTGAFTAPVEGLYQFNYIEHNGTGAGANTGISVTKNGVFYRQLHTIQVLTSTRYANTISWSMELDAGDVVHIQLLGITRNILGSAGGAAIKSSFEGFLVR